MPKTARFLLLLLLRSRSRPSRQHSKVPYHWGVRRKDWKTRKSKNEEKVAGFISASLFSGRKREVVTQAGTMGIDHLTRRRTKGASFVKVWEDKRDRGRIPDTFM